MRLVDCRCPACQAPLTGLKENSQVQCKYCNCVFYVDDEVKRLEASISVSVPNAEEVGYSLEMGKLRAQQEIAKEERAKEASKLEEQKRKERNLKMLKVLLWVLFFPIMAVVFLIRTNKLGSEVKFVLFILLIVLIIKVFGG